MSFELHKAGTISEITLVKNFYLFIDWLINWLIAMVDHLALKLFMENEVMAKAL